MSDVAIKVDNLSKQYRLGVLGTGTISHDLNKWWHQVRGKEDPYAVVGQINDRAVKAENEYVWALKDINFEVKKGEILGIIGRNGAGKSTLLKILSKVTGPSAGKIDINGRIAALLEVGTGFHPELTGRENVYLNGAILGMTKKEISRKFDEIVDFSGCEKYIDTPVKRYSSGMIVRLGFAVAAHLEPEILIVDEVLAVGDAEFQGKCIGKMKDVSVNDGRTVIFVSHDMQAVSNLTKQAILMTNGKIYSSGMTMDVIHQYLAISKSDANTYVSDNEINKPSIQLVKINTSLVNNVHECTEPLEIEFTLHSPYPIHEACFSFQIVDTKGRNYVHQWVFDSDQPYFREAGYVKLICKIPSLKLYMGKYYLKCYFSEAPGRRIFEVLEDICPFEVVMYKVSRSKFQWSPECCAYLEEASWIIEKKY